MADLGPPLQTECVPDARTPRRTLATAERSDRRGEPHVRLRGELDISNTDLIAGLLLVVPAGPSVVVLDLGCVSFLDSTAVMALVALSEDFAKRRQELRIVAPAGHLLHRILSILVLGDKLPLWNED